MYVHTYIQESSQFTTFDGDCSANGRPRLRLGETPCAAIIIRASACTLVVRFACIDKLTAALAVDSSRDTSTLPCVCLSLNGARKLQLAEIENLFTVQLMQKKKIFFFFPPLRISKWLWQMPELPRLFTVAKRKLMRNLPRAKTPLRSNHYG
jgi:hypothetical protein